MPKPKVEDGQFFFDVRGNRDDERGGAHLIDGGSRQTGHQVAGQPVTQLSVDVVRVQYGAGQFGPRIGVLIGEARAADDTDPAPRLLRQAA